MIKEYKRILIANRGDSAVRVIRACKEMGIETVSVCSKADKEAFHNRIADFSVCIGDVRSKDSYLNSYNILAVATEYKVDAIHPGIGYLAENADFAELCERCGIDFIGPNSNVINLMGNKIEAKSVAKECGVPVIGDNSLEAFSFDDCLKHANAIGYPLILKASNGGGGKGIRVVGCEEYLPHLLETCQKETEQVFGKSSILIEKYIENGKHVEVQVLADQYGNVIHLGDRECTIQRKNQKLIEETRCATLPNEVRKSMYQDAINICKHIGYVGLGTVEYILDENNSYYFMEMNTRMQVEHTISELITGIDLVKEQIRIAQGAPLLLKQKDIQFNGYAMQCRILAECFKGNFVPSHGKITRFDMPGGLGVRVDTSYEMGNVVSPYYDSLLCKICCYGIDKLEAINRMVRCLNEIRIEGVENNKEFLVDIIKNPRFLQGDYTTAYLDTIINS